MLIRFDPDEWRPELPGAWTSRTESTDRLTPGTLVAWDRRPYRVVEVRERDLSNWPDKYVEAWEKAGRPDPATWYTRPRVVVLKPEDEPGGKPLHLQGPNTHRWYTLPEHYPLCRLCQELPPCRHVHTERVMARAQEKLDEDMSLMAGVCHGCREPVTKRQKTFTFPGANLIRPDLGDGTAIFHTRQACYGCLKGYDRRWAKAEPDRSQFFYCEGRLTQHHDGSSECSEPDCTAKGPMGDYVEHERWLRHHPLMPDAHGCWCLAGLLA